MTKERANDTEVGPDLATPLTDAEIIFARTFAEISLAENQADFTQTGYACFAHLISDWQEVLNALMIKDQDYLSNRENFNRIKWWAWHQMRIERSNSELS